MTNNDAVLIAQRSRPESMRGKWEFPGGKLEVGETEQACLQRELFEEFGIRATVGDYVCSSFFTYEGNAYEMRAYWVPLFIGEIVLHEHLQTQWVPILSLASFDILEQDKPIVKKLTSLQK